MNVIHHNRNFLIEPGIHWAYLAPGGKACLVTDKGLRFISGIIIATRNSVTWIYFRRGRI